ncbi:MAG: EamA family transporter [Patescibacteria group bacterium]|nr:EamA family transporter [Patescibacteria group bacterium]
MKKSIKILAALAIISAAFLWALDGVYFTPWILNLGLYDVPIFVFMLHLTGAIILSYFLITRKKELKNLNKKDWLSFILVGIFGGALGTMAIIGAISQVHANHLNISVVLILQKLQPIFAILLAYAWLRERPRKSFYAWALVALVGSYLLTFGFTKANFSATGMLIPALLAALAAFSFGSSTVFSKRAIKKISHGLGTALRFFITTGIMFLIIIIISLLNSGGVNTGYAGFAGFNVITWSMIGVFFLIAVTVGAGAIFIYYWGLKKVMASRATIYELFYPLSSILLEYFFHDNLLKPGQWLGAGVILTAIIAITRNRK